MLVRVDTRVRRTCFGTRLNRFREDSVIAIYANLTISLSSAVGMNGMTIYWICAIIKEIFRGNLRRYFMRLTSLIRKLKLQSLNYTVNLYLFN